MPTPRLRTVNLTRHYSGTVALDGVSLEFEGGKIHALLGKNGAGKSTLIKLLSGSIQPTAGQMFVDGQEFTPRSPGDAFRKGMATVHQELSLLPQLSVAENIWLGRMPVRTTIGLKRIDWQTTGARAAELLDELHAGIDPHAIVGQLSVAQQQIVEIAKAMSFAPGVLMLDEPTSALPRHEAQQLFNLIRQLARRGVAVLYITHRLGELDGLVDTVTILRDGRVAAIAPFEQMDAQGIVRTMFGDCVPKARPADLRVQSEPALELRSFTHHGCFEDISLTLRRGEILGLAGQLGSGRTSLLRSIFGADRHDSGEVILGGRRVRPRSPAQMRDAGVAMLPENRKEHGLVLDHSVHANFFLASLGRFSHFGISSGFRERAVAAELTAALALKAPHMEDPVASLSGGNQQKVVLGKWINARPRVMLLDEPTRGIDLHAKQQIFELICQLAGSGVACLLVSSELEELLDICHRILILKEGRIVDQVRGDSVSVDDLWMRCINA
jgi:ribose transport system ATP-binding protein